MICKNFKRNCFAADALLEALRSKRSFFAWFFGTLLWSSEIETSTESGKRIKKSPQENKLNKFCTNDYPFKSSHINKIRFHFSISLTLSTRDDVLPTSKMSKLNAIVSRILSEQACVTGMNEYFQSSSRINFFMHFLQRCFPMHFWEN